MKPLLLVICPVTERMVANYGAHYEAVHVDDTADEAFLAERGAEVTAVLTDGHLGVGPALMERLPNLGIVSCYGVGYDNIDAAAARARGIVVTHTPDVLNDEVANTALMLMLAVFRQLVEQDAYVRAGRWGIEGNAPLTRSPQNRRVGLLGMGRIGLRIAEKIAVLDPEIRYHARSRKDLPYRFCPDLVAMARAVEVLICITPGGADTAGLVGREVLDALGPEGVLINVSRGSVVDEPALIAALEAGRLGGAGLDVFANEPHVPEALRRSPRVVLLPHMGSGTIETRRAMGDLACRNLSRFARDGTVATPVPECAGM